MSWRGDEFINNRSHWFFEQRKVDTMVIVSDGFWTVGGFVIGDKIGGD